LENKIIATNMQRRRKSSFLVPVLGSGSMTFCLGEREF